jgi:8-oxo-dGTP pyrophosphatase MutT (NUDIX family)
VEVYVFRRRRGRVEFLALRRSADRVKLPGVWQPVTGKIDRGETVIQAAAREVLEETGLVPRRWWTLETCGVFYEPKDDGVRVLPLFAAEAGPSDRVRLSEEHQAQRFVSAAQARRLYLWEAQRRAIDAVRREVLGRPALARALAITPPAPKQRRSRRSTRSQGG